MSESLDVAADWVAIAIVDSEFAKSIVDYSETGNYRIKRRAKIRLIKALLSSLLQSQEPFSYSQHSLTF